MAKNRLIGDYPVIGIRPTIDGRRGALKVRESLEEQTMNMAKAAAKLFTDNLKYSNGEPVKVVIADTTIGRVAEAAACAEKFKKEGVDITLTVTPCWCYGSETMDMDKNHDVEIKSPTLDGGDTVDNKITEGVIWQQLLFFFFPQQQALHIVLQSCLSLTVGQLFYQILFL